MSRIHAARVLVVEDRPDSRGRLAYMLNQFGFHRVLEARNGREAVAVLSRMGVDLVIADRDLANDETLALLRLLRTHPATAKLPFILISARNDAADVAAAIAAGVSAYLVKPVAAPVLRRKIEAVIGVPA